MQSRAFFTEGPQNPNFLARENFGCLSQLVLLCCAWQFSKRRDSARSPSRKLSTAGPLKRSASTDNRSLSTNREIRTVTMSAFQNGDRPLRSMEDDSDVEEEALVNDYKEQVQYEDGLGEELERVNSLTMAQQQDDIQSRLVAAAQPLDFSAPLEVKFQSYDAYCNLFHFILNSEGPVDLEPPSVSGPYALRRALDNC